MNGPSKPAFDDLVKRGLRVRSTHIKGFIGVGTGRLGMATAKSIGSHARRNHVRRRFRSAVLASGFDHPEADWVLIIGQSGSRLPYRDVIEDVRVWTTAARERWEQESESS